MAHTSVTKTHSQNTGAANTFSYSGSFDTFKESEVVVTLDAVALTYQSGTINESASPREYTVDYANKTIHIGGLNLTSGTIIIRPVTDMGAPTARATYSAGSSITADDLNNNQKQLLRKAMEYDEQKLSSTGGTMTGDLTLGEDTKIIFEGATDDGYETTLTVADPSGSDKTITLPNTTGTVVTTGDTGTVTATMLAANSVDSSELVDGSIDASHIANDAVNSQHYAAGSIDLEHMSANSVDSDQYVDGSIDLAHMSANSVDSDQYVDGSIDSAHIANDQIDSQHYAAGSIDLEHMSANSVDSDQYVDGSIDHVHLAADIIDGDNIQDDVINSEHYVAGSIDNEHLADDAVGADELADNAVVNASIATGAAIAHNKLANVSSGQVIVGNGSNVPTAVAMSGDVAIAAGGATTIQANSIEIGMIGCEQTTISDSDSHIPTSGAVVDYVAAQIAPIGGLEVIADDESFPNTIPPAGVVISISDAAGLSVNSSGVSTNGDALDNSTITINGFPSELRGGVNGNADPYVFASGAGLMVQSTGSSHTYNYHQALIREADFVQLSDDISDFNSRYRIGTKTADNHSSNDDGDLFFDTGANKMYVYDGAYNSGGSWKEVTSAGDFKFLTVKDHDQASGGSGPTFNGSNEEFDLFDGSSDASVNSAAQLIVVLNGVIQKPNTGSFDGNEEGFYLNDTHGIKFCDPPASGSTLFVTQIGSAVALNEPADDSVSAAKIQSGAVSLAKMASESVDEDNLYISNSGSNGQFLQKQSGNNGGLTWATVDLTTFTADVTFDNQSNAGRDIIWDESADALEFQDDTKATFGTDNDIEIYHSSGQSYIQNSTGNFRIDADNLRLRSKTGSEALISATVNGAVELYYDNAVRIETTAAGATISKAGDSCELTVKGGEAEPAVLMLSADEADDNADNWRLVAGTGGAINLQNYASGSWENSIECNGNGNVELYYDNSKKFETLTTGVRAQGGIAFGSDTAAANHLDDYEEGNFTPVFVLSGASFPNMTGTGQYTKIGDTVHLTGQITWDTSSTASGSGAIYIALPFTMIDDARGGIAIGLNSGFQHSSNHTLSLIPEIDAAVMYIVECEPNNVGHTHLDATSVTNSGSRLFSFGGTFHTS